MSLPAVPQFMLPSINGGCGEKPQIQPQAQASHLNPLPSSQVYHPAPTPAPQAMLLNSDHTRSMNWYPDSSASHHVTSQGINIQPHSPYEGPDQAYMGNGQGLCVSSSGSSKFNSPLNPAHTLTLHDLIDIPTITRNLVSVSKFAKDNMVFFEFHPDTCLVKSQATKEVLVQGTLGNDGMHVFSNILSAPAPTANYVSTADATVRSGLNKYNSTYLLWHNRLGHPCSEIQRMVLHNCNIPFSNKGMLDFCSSCCLGKAHKLPSHSTTQYTSPLALIFCDLWGQPPSLPQMDFNIISPLSLGFTSLKGSLKQSPYLNNSKHW